MDELAIKRHPKQATLSMASTLQHSRAAVNLGLVTIAYNGRAGWTTDFPFKGVVRGHTESVSVGSEFAPPCLRVDDWLLNLDKEPKDDHHLLR